jgi:hypothetical protein
VRVTPCPDCGGPRSLPLVPNTVDAAGAADTVVCLDCYRRRPASTLTGPPWRHGRARELARQVYADRAWPLLPVLADLLEEEGCGVPDVLEHLRRPGLHCRGCWPVDYLLGRR